MLQCFKVYPQTATIKLALQKFLRGLTVHRTDTWDTECNITSILTQPVLANVPQLLLTCPYVEVMCLLHYGNCFTSLGTLFCFWMMISTRQWSHYFMIFYFLLKNCIWREESFIQCQVTFSKFKFAHTNYLHS